MQTDIQKWNLAIPLGLLLFVALLGTVLVVNGGEPAPSGWPDIDIDSIENFNDVGVSHVGGYGAWYIEDDVAYVYMNDLRKDPEAAFNAIYDGEPLDLPIQAVMSNYEYDELDGWRRYVNEVNREDVRLSSTSIGFAESRILFGVLTIEEIEPAIEWIAAQGVPRDAFEVHLDLFQPESFRGN